MTRQDFVQIINERGYKRGAELGVAKGEFSSVLANSNLESLVLVDKWNDHHGDDERLYVLNLFRYDKRVMVLRETFETAALRFPDGYFDFIYIDGYAASGQEDGKTLEQWWPKLRSGGMFSGHDFHPDWMATVRTVLKFADEHDLVLRTTHERYGSWYATKVE